VTPQEFIAKWGSNGPAYALNERQGAQAHFIDLCQLLGVPTPGTDADYIFEQDTLLFGATRGYADVFMRNHFAWENKAPGRNLDSALKQLLGYSLALDNPPLLVVSDRLIIRIHTQFNGHPSEVYTVLLQELDQPEKQALLRRLWTAPESFRPKKTSRDITEAAAKSFATLADGLRKRGPSKTEDPHKWQIHADEVAHFLTQCLFCFFAEDVNLLPGRMFERLVANKTLTSEKLTEGLKNLFVKMRTGGMYGNDDIPWFNGGLFKKVSVPKLTIMEMTELRNAASLNWSAIDVSIFGTLFERGLDPSKRSQLGAHYTDPATIMRIIEPVLIRPLAKKWEIARANIAVYMDKTVKRGDKHHKAAHKEFVRWLEMLKEYRLLDPACGSGNFLFLGLKSIKDIEHKSHLEAAALGLDREADLVTGPYNVLGIELNEYAAELARVTVWIGELQWRIEHGYGFKTNPVLEPLDHIECRDALLKFDAIVTEAEWPKANTVIGNPPFLGGGKKRGELGSSYFDALNQVYSERVPGFGDLVCYWFAKSLSAIKSNNLEAAGLVTTNSIRGGANRKVLDAIVEQSHVFDAWSDESWVNDGAAVRVSLICFGDSDAVVHLDGVEVQSIHSDLTPAHADGSTADLTTAKPLRESAMTCFMGSSKKGPFDIDGQLAREWLSLPNPNGRSNAEVIKPLCNGIDLTRRWGDRWIVDFGTTMTEEEASLFEVPYSYITNHVRPLREKNNRESYRKFWWRHAEPRPGMRAALANINRYIITAAVAKHRTFIWMSSAVLADQATLATARADDTTFGVLHSRLHEIWSLRMGTSLEDRPRYTPTTCFETFPFPVELTPKNTAHQKTEELENGVRIPAGLTNLKTRENAVAIACAAKRLNDLRDEWLNPSGWTDRVPEVIPLGMNESLFPDRIMPKHAHEKEVSERTLTKLYNLKPSWLDSAHQSLDHAVACAYGWSDYTSKTTDEDVLKRLLSLNLIRSSSP
jgi:hypothetical protein